MSSRGEWFGSSLANKDAMSEDPNKPAGSTVLILYCGFFHQLVLFFLFDRAKFTTE